MAINIDEEKTEYIIQNYIDGIYENNQDEKIINDYILNNNDFFDMFVEISEQSAIPVPENFTASVMQKINAVNSIKTAKSIRVIPALSRKLRAAVCFASAIVITLSAVFGLNSKIIDFLSYNLDKLEKIGEIFNVITKFKIN
ncbi:MAG: hypothetical protein FWD71_21475 [Oscillospiraceae bacterium]|nr:hypothetical protein [Oscillospiraceae bacterium]